MSIYLRGKSWYYDFVHKGQRYTGTFGCVSRTVAKEELARKKAGVLEGRLNPAKDRRSPQLHKFAEDYLEWSEGNKKRRTYERDITSLNALRPSFGGARLSDITPWQIEKYKRERRAKGRSNQTIKLELACLKAMFNKALLWGQAVENPVKKVNMPQVHNTRVRFLEEEEEAVLILECRGYLSAIVQVALATGFRRAELLSLKPADVDFARGLVSVQAGYAKNGEARAVPMTSRARAILSRLADAAKGKSNAALFRNMHDDPLRPYALREAFTGTVQRAGISDFHFHDLRHTFASRLVMAGVDLRTVQELMGRRPLAFSPFGPDPRRSPSERMLWPTKSSGPPVTTAYPRLSLSSTCRGSKP